MNRQCKRCNGTRTITKLVVFVDRLGMQHERERTAPCPCLQSAPKPISGMMEVNESWSDKQRTYLKEQKDAEVMRKIQHLSNGTIRRRAA